MKLENAWFDGDNMTKLFCTQCGREIDTKFGIVPLKCTCGADLSEWDNHSAKKIVFHIAALLLLMLPFLLAVYFLRKVLQDSLILYAIMLVTLIIYLRQAEGLLIRSGILKMKNIELK